MEFGRKLRRELALQQRRRDEATAMIPKATKIATSQIAILRVRGWRAISVARPRSSVILGAIFRENER